MKVLVSLGLLVVGGVALAQDVTYNGARLSWDDDRPYTAGGVVMLPARDTASRVNANFERTENGRRITLTWNNNVAKFRQGDYFFTLNGRSRNLKRSSEAQNGVLYMPFEIFRLLTDDQLKMGGGIRPPVPGRGIYFDRQQVSLTGGNAPYSKAGTMMVPFRAFGDAIGARTDRTPDGKRVWIYFGTDRVEYDKGHNWFRMNQDRKSLPTGSEDQNGILFVPIELYVTATRGRVSMR